MKTRWLIMLGVIIAAAVAFIWHLERPKPPRFVTAPAGRGDVTRSIITTGSVNPVVTVQVGSNVSGTIQSLYCDYNTKVKAGQLCAKIDPKPFQLALDQAKADLAMAEAQLVNDPAIVLADEPTGNLDSKTSNDIMTTIQTLNREKGVTIVLVTHEKDMAAFADRVVTMRDGVIVSDELNIQSTAPVPPGQPRVSTSPEKPCESGRFQKRLLFPRYGAEGGLPRGLPQ